MTLCQMEYFCLKKETLCLSNETLCQTGTLCLDYEKLRQTGYLLSNFRAFFPVPANDAGLLQLAGTTIRENTHLLNNHDDF